MGNNRPKSSAFGHQKLPSWRPIMTAGSVLPIFIAIGVIFIPLGITFIMASNGIQELVVEYTNNCQSKKNNVPCYIEISRLPGTICQCDIQLNLTEEFLGQVFLYYGLEKFYQNHRRYLKSGEDSWHFTDEYSEKNSDPLQGILETSLFNDTFVLWYKNNEEITQIHITKEGIAWDSDIRRWNRGNNGSYPPPEEKLVWMRAAALPEFRKLRGKIKHTGIFITGLPVGTYILSINYTYPVIDHGGKKKVILTTTSWLGSKNRFLGIAYISTGAVSALFGILVTIFRIKSRLQLVP